MFKYAYVTIKKSNSGISWYARLFPILTENFDYGVKLKDN
jgi:hypothetical protein